MAKNHGEIVRKLISNSNHPRYGYPLALLIIHMVCLATETCSLGLAKTHFYNRAHIVLTAGENAGSNNPLAWTVDLLNLFYEYVLCLVYDFDKMWFEEKPKDIMMYGTIRAKFDQVIKSRLHNPTTRFLVEVRTV